MTGRVQKLVILLGLGFSAFAAGCTQNTPTQSVSLRPPVYINEFLAKSARGTPDWVELYNAGLDTVDLSGYWMTDDLTKPVSEWFEIPDDTRILPGRFLLFRKKKGSLFRLKSGGEQLFLLTPDRKQVVDHHTFFEQTPDVSEGRYPDGGPDWVRFGKPTPGQSNAGAATSACENVVINEILAINEHSGSNPISGHADWIELYNRSELEIELGGFYLSDDPAQPTKWKIPGGTRIPGKGFLLIWADNAKGPLHASFKLSGSGESVLFVAPDGHSVCDRIDFGKQQADVSLGRLPDGAERWQNLHPTPGAPNQP